jgi:hypothetical protein
MLRQALHFLFIPHAVWYENFHYFCVMGNGRDTAPAIVGQVIRMYFLTAILKGDKARPHRRPYFLSINQLFAMKYKYIFKYNYICYYIDMLFYYLDYIFIICTSSIINHVRGIVLLAEQSGKPVLESFLPSFTIDSLWAKIFQKENPEHVKIRYPCQVRTSKRPTRFFF